MKIDKNLLKKRWFAYTFASCSAVVLFMALTHMGLFWKILCGIWDVGKPVFMALVIAYVLDPLVTLYSERLLQKARIAKMRHTLSVLLAILTVILFFTVLMVALVPQVVQSAAMFVRNMNGYVGTVQGLIRHVNELCASHGINLEISTSTSDEILNTVTKWLSENLNKILNVSYGLGSSVFGWVISFILAIYLMMDGPRLKGGFVRLMKALLPDAAYQNTSTFWSRCNEILVRYIAFDLLDGLIIGLANWIFMLVLGMKYVAVVSVIVGVTNLAPTIGPMAGAVLGAFILFLVNPWHALWFLLFTLFLQTVDGYILKPRLFGGQLGVSSVWILIALIIGGRLLGIVGILLAIPLAAIADFVYNDYIIARLEKRKTLHRGEPHSTTPPHTAGDGLNNNSQIRGGLHSMMEPPHAVPHAEPPEGGILDAADAVREAAADAVRSGSPAHQDFI